MIKPWSAGGVVTEEPVDTRIAATAWVAVGSKSETITSDCPAVEPAPKYELVVAPVVQGDSCGATEGEPR
jgi:hypothetical protein